MFRKLVSAFLILVLIFCLTACSPKDPAESGISVSLADAPLNLDPIMAKNDTERTIALNTYEGLLRCDASGNIIAGVSDNYTVSADGLTYTFNIPGNAVWSNSAPVTAFDFEFGIKRALDPKTNAPLASTLDSIKNANEVLAGTNNVNSIGVKATDNNTLIINLISPNPDFAYVLTTPIAMPCNEKFFLEQNGYYGLSKDQTLSNGSYRVSKWDEEIFTLSKSDTYSGSLKANFGYVSLSFSGLEEKLQEAETDLILADDNIISGDISDFNKTDFNNTCWGILMNKNAPFANDYIRIALLTAIDYPSLDFSKTPALNANDSFLPESIIGSENVHTSRKYNYSPDSSRKLFIDNVKSLPNATFPTVTLIYPDLIGFDSVASQIAEAWQSKLGAYVNIQAVEDISALKSTVSSGNYQIALYPLSADTPFAKNYLEQFVSTSKRNIFGISDPVIDAAVKALPSLSSSEEVLNSTTDVCEALTLQSLFTPIAKSSLSIVYKKDYTGVVFTKSGLIDFSFVNYYTE